MNKNIKPLLNLEMAGQMDTFLSEFQDWILALLDDTVKEIDLDEWCSALAGAMSSHLQVRIIFLNRNNF